jgi:hypothetical protein
MKKGDKIQRMGAESICRRKEEEEEEEEEEEKRQRRGGNRTKPAAHLA